MVEVATEVAERGAVWLRAASTADELAPLHQMVWRHVEATTPVRLADPTTWSFDGSFGLRRVEERPAWSVLHSNPHVVRALDEILGAGCWEQPTNRQILLTFPTPPPWSMPSGWHVDFACEQPTWPVPAVKLFTLLDRVEPGGGGTVVLLGSHRLVEQMAKGEGAPPDAERVHALLDSHPHLRRLRNGSGDRELLDEEVVVRGVPLRPVELSGDAGDTFVTHIHVFHAPAPNVGDRPRQMVGAAVRRVGA